GAAMKVVPSNPWLRLLATWAVMLVLVGISVGVAVMLPGIGIWHSVINLVIAGLLIIMVMSFFMHLATSEHILRLMAGMGFFWLIFMFALGLADYFSRVYPY